MSGYIDGRLSNEEKAEVEHHLEECRECRVFFEKLKKLNREASGVIEDIDDRLLDRLERRIMSEIETPVDKKSIVQDGKKKVIPIWYRYVAVAASLVLVFMVGKMAYDDYFLRLFEPPQPTPDYQKHEKERVEPEAFQDT